MVARRPVSDCIPWFVVLVAECLAIVILNTITIIVFLKKRQLQRRSTYLIIHLAIVDLLVGVVCGPLQIEHALTLFCNMGNYNSDLTWSFYVKLSFRHLFSFTSLVNLSAISLERLHATFFPVRHRLVKKWIYRVTIIVVWLTTSTREAAQILLLEVSSGNRTLNNKILYLPFYYIFIFVICLSYFLIVVKVRCSRHPQFHGASKRERKLTGTSLIVALVSLLCLLPALMYLAILLHIGNRVNTVHVVHIYMSVLVAFLANSIINPVIYAMRMPGFRTGITEIFCRAQNRIPWPTATNRPLLNLRTA